MIPRQNRRRQEHRQRFLSYNNRSKGSQHAKDWRCLWSEYKAQPAVSPFCATSTRRDQSHVVKLKHAAKVDSRSGDDGRGSLFMARRIQSNESNLALTCRRWLRCCAMLYPRLWSRHRRAFLEPSVAPEETLACLALPPFLPSSSRPRICMSPRTRVRWPKAESHRASARGDDPPFS